MFNVELAIGSSQVIVIASRSLFVIDNAKASPSATLVITGAFTG